MVKVNVDLDKYSYAISYKGILKSVEVDLYEFFFGLELFEEGVDLITPEWFNAFHKSFFLEMKSRMSVIDKIKLRIFGTTVNVLIKERLLKDDLILRTLFGIFEHLMWARIVRFHYNDMRINNIKFEYEIQILAKQFAKSKNGKFRIRSKIHNLDGYYSE